MSIYCILYYEKFNTFYQNNQYNIPCKVNKKKLIKPFKPGQIAFKFIDHRRNIKLDKILIGEVVGSIAVLKPTLVLEAMGLTPDANHLLLSKHKLLVASVKEQRVYLLYTIECIVKNI